VQSLCFLLLNEGALQFSKMQLQDRFNEGYKFSKKVFSFEKMFLRSLKTVIIMHAAIHTKAVNVPSVADINCKFSCN